MFKAHTQQVLHFYEQRDKKVFYPWNCAKIYKITHSRWKGKGIGHRSLPTVRPTPIYQIGKQISSSLSLGRGHSPPFPTSPTTLAH